MINYDKELEAIQIWIKATTGLDSIKLSVAKPKQARPVILWETPSRGVGRKLSRYDRTERVKQYGILFISKLEEVMTVQSQLFQSLAEKESRLNITVDGTIIYLKEIELNFDNSETTDVRFSVSYEVAYGKTRPEQAPHATKVQTTVTVKGV